MITETELYFLVKLFIYSQTNIITISPTGLSKYIKKNPFIYNGRKLKIISSSTFVVYVVSKDSFGTKFLDI